MEKTTYEMPLPVESRYRYGLVQRTINYNIEQTDDGGWQYRSITLSPGAWNYSTIVSALINAECPPDQMQAIVNNYLLDPQDTEAAAEMAEMQKLRAWAKELAKELLENY